MAGWQTGFACLGAVLANIELLALGMKVPIGKIFKHL